MKRRGRLRVKESTHAKKTEIFSYNFEWMSNFQSIHLLWKSTCWRREGVNDQEQEFSKRWIWGGGGEKRLVWSQTRWEVRQQCRLTKTGSWARFRHRDEALESSTCSTSTSRHSSYSHLTGQNRPMCFEIKYKHTYRKADITNGEKHSNELKHAGVPAHTLTRLDSSL